ncbi:MAG: hypothetical protein H0U25_11600, partial [Thermoleophilaceae bacterium]|nr:hypothetical protein [Thermoleophilaceae bacterium]
MRVLFFMAHAGFTRNYESLICSLTDKGHTVTVALDRAYGDRTIDRDYPLKRLSARLEGLEVVPTPARDTYREAGQQLRVALDYARYLDPGYAEAVKPRERARARVPAVLAKMASLSAGRPAVERLLRAAERSVPVTAAVSRFIVEQRPTVALVTPLVELGSPQVDYVRAARALGIPSALLVASWDNLTIKGGVHDSPDLVAVWNEAQKREAVELHGIAPARVVATGAAAYDHWFEWKPSRSREDFCRSAELDPARPYLLYVGSSKFIAPLEPRFVEEWARLVRASDAFSGVDILYRPHPTNAPSDEQTALLRGLGIAVHPASGANPTDGARRADYFDALHFSAAVIGVSTSAFIEGAILGRRPHALLGRYPESQEGTLHFKHLLEERGGPLRTAGTPKEHLDQLAETLRTDPADVRRQLRPFIERFVRPAGVEHDATGPLVSAIERLAYAASPAPIPV